MTNQEFDTFFETYAKSVDDADHHGFWKLSDALIQAIIQKHIPVDSLSSSSIILDAGGGTGRWIVKLAQIFPTNFTLLDRSQDMLKQAEKNIQLAKLSNRTLILQGDLCSMRGVGDESIDHIVSIYSPLSFIDERLATAKELYRILKPGGLIFVMGHGYYNALASKGNGGLSGEALQRLNKDMIVKWAPHVPELATFSKESIEKLFIEAGFCTIMTYGVPVFIQPGPEDWDPHNVQKSTISKALEQPEVFRALFELEMEHNGHPSVVNRGMNIFSVMKKEAIH